MLYFPITALSAILLVSASLSGAQPVAQQTITCSPCFRYDKLQGTVVTNLGDTACLAQYATASPYPSKLNVVAGATPYRVQTAGVPNMYDMASSSWSALLIGRNASHYGSSDLRFYLPRSFRREWFNTLYLHSYVFGLQANVTTYPTFEAREDAKEFCTDGPTLYRAPSMPFERSTAGLARALALGSCAARNVRTEMGNKTVLIVDVMGKTGRMLRNANQLAEALQRRGLIVDRQMFPKYACDQISLLVKDYALIITPSGPHVTNFVVIHGVSKVLEVVAKGGQTSTFCRIGTAFGNQWHVMLAAGAPGARSELTSVCGGKGLAPGEDVGMRPVTFTDSDLKAIDGLVG